MYRRSASWCTGTQAPLLSSRVEWPAGRPALNLASFGFDRWRRHRQAVLQSVPALP
ncbi:MAG: hypothetical protein ACYDBW_08255 [Sulfuricaulis sp.]